MAQNIFKFTKKSDNRWDGWGFFDESFGDWGDKVNRVIKVIKVDRVNGVDGEWVMSKLGCYLEWI